MSKLAGKIITTPRVKSNFQNAIRSNTPLRERAKSTNFNFEKSEQMLKKLAQNLGFNKTDSSESQPQKLLIFLTEKFTKILEFLHRSQAQRISLQNQLSCIKADFQEQLTVNRNLIQQAKQKVAHSDDDYASVQSTRQLLGHQQTHKFIQEMNKKNREIIECQGQNQTLIEQIQRQREKRQKLEQTLDLFKRELRNANSDKQEYRQKYRQALEEKNSSDSKLHTFMQQKRKIMNLQKNLKQKMTAFEKEIDEKDREILNYREQIKDNVLKNGKFIKSIKSLQKQNEKLGAQLKSKQSRLQTLRTLNQKFESKSSQILKKCEGLTEINQKYRVVLKENQQLKQTILQKTLELKAYSPRNSIQKSPLSSQYLSNNSTQRDAIPHQQEFIAANMQAIKDKTNELIRVKQLNKMLNSKYLQVKHRLDKLQQNNQQSQENSRDLQKLEANHLYSSFEQKGHNKPIMLDQEQQIKIAAGYSAQIDDKSITSKFQGQNIQSFNSKKNDRLGNNQTMSKEEIQFLLELKPSQLEFHNQQHLSESEKDELTLALAEEVELSTEDK